MNPISLIINEGANVDAVLDAMLNEGFVSDTASHALGQTLGQTGANVASFYLAKHGIKSAIDQKKADMEKSVDNKKNKIKDFIRNNKGILGLTAGLALMSGKNKLTKRQQELNKQP